MSFEQKHKQTKLILYVSPNVFSSGFFLCGFSSLIVVWAGVPAVEGGVGLQHPTVPRLQPNSNGYNATQRHIFSNALLQNQIWLKSATFRKNVREKYFLSYYFKIRYGENLQHLEKKYTKNI